MRAAKIRETQASLEEHIRFTENLLDAGLDDAAYQLVFDDEHFMGGLQKLFGTLEYYLPDTTYEEDARAKLGQLKQYRELIVAMLGETV